MRFCEIFQTLEVVAQGRVDESRQQIGIHRLEVGEIHGSGTAQQDGLRIECSSEDVAEDHNRITGFDLPTFLQKVDCLSDAVFGLFGKFHGVRVDATIQLQCADDSFIGGKGEDSRVLGALMSGVVGEGCRER